MVHIVELRQATTMAGHVERFLSSLRVKIWESHLGQMVDMRFPPPMEGQVERFLSILMFHLWESHLVQNMEPRGRSWIQDQPRWVRKQ